MLPVMAVASETPHERHRSRSRSRLVALVTLAVVGCLLSLYLTSFQLGLVADVWDPLFGAGSRRVLTSAVAQLLPVPDASLGAIVYALDAILAALLVSSSRTPSGTPARGERRLAIALAVVAVGGAVAGVTLAVAQPLAVGTFCTLCLVSTAISLVLAIGAIAELRERLRAASAEQRTPLEAVE